MKGDNMRQQPFTAGLAILLLGSGYVPTMAVDPELSITWLAEPTADSPGGQPNGKFTFAVEAKSSSAIGMPSIWLTLMNKSNGLIYKDRYFTVDDMPPQDDPPPEEGEGGEAPPPPPVQLSGRVGTAGNPELSRKYPNGEYYVWIIGVFGSPPQQTIIVSKIKSITIAGGDPAEAAHGSLSSSVSNTGNNVATSGTATSTATPGDEVNGQVYAFFIPENAAGDFGGLVISQSTNPSIKNGANQDYTINSLNAPAGKFRVLVTASIRIGSIEREVGSGFSAITVPAP